MKLCIRPPISPLATIFCLFSWCSLSPGISTTSAGSGDGTPSTATVKGRTSYNSGLPCHNIPRPWLICCSRVRSSPPSNPLRRRLFGVLETRAHRQQTIALSLKNVEFFVSTFHAKAQGFEVILSKKHWRTSPSSGGTFALLAPLLGLLWLGWYAWFGGGTRTLGSPQRQQWQLSCTGRDFGDLSVSFEVADSRSCLKRQCSGPVDWWQFWPETSPIWMKIGWCLNPTSFWDVKMLVLPFTKKGIFMSWAHPTHPWWNALVRVQIAPFLIWEYLFPYFFFKRKADCVKWCSYSKLCSF